MEFQQPKKRNEMQTVFEHEDETEVRFDNKETVYNQRNDKWEEINSYRSEENVTVVLEGEKDIFDN